MVVLLLVLLLAGGGRKYQKLKTCRKVSPMRGRSGPTPCGSARRWPADRQGVGKSLVAIDPLGHPADRQGAGIKFGGSGSDTLRIGKALACGSARHVGFLEHSTLDCLCVYLFAGLQMYRYQLKLALSDANCCQLYYELPILLCCLFAANCTDCAMSVCCQLYYELPQLCTGTAMYCGWGPLR